MSRAALSEASGVSRSTIAHIERGDQRPLPGTLRKLAASLTVSIDALAPDWEDAEFARPKSGYEHPGVGLRAFRKERNLTLQQLASATGVSVSTISRLERGLHATRRLTSRDAAGVSDIDQLGVVCDSLADQLGFASAEALTKACAGIEDP